MSRTHSAFVLFFDEETKPIVEKKNLIIDLDIKDVSGADLRSVLFSGDSTQWSRFDYDTAQSISFPYKWSEFTYDGADYDNTNSVLSKMQQALNLHQLDCYDDCSILEFHKHMAHVTGLHDLCSVKCFLSLAEFKAKIEAMGYTAPTPEEKDESDTVTSERVAGDHVIVMVGVCYRNPRPEIPDIQVNLRYRIDETEVSDLLSAAVSGDLYDYQNPQSDPTPTL